LGREDGGDQQLQRVGMIQLAVGVRVGAVQQRYDEPGSLHL